MKYSREFIKQSIERQERYLYNLGLNNHDYNDKRFRDLHDSANGMLLYWKQKLHEYKKCHPCTILPPDPILIGCGQVGRKAAHHILNEELPIVLDTIKREHTLQEVVMTITNTYENLITPTIKDAAPVMDGKARRRERRKNARVR